MKNEKEKLQAQLSATEETMASLQKKIHGLVSVLPFILVSVKSRLRSELMLLFCERKALAETNQVNQSMRI